MGIGSDMKTGKAAMDLLDDIMHYYNNGYNATAIAALLGLRRDTVEILLDIARAVDKRKKK